MREESKNIEPVVHADHYHTLLGQVGTVLPGLGGGTGAESAAIDPHHYGQVRFLRGGGRPDIQIKAVFAGSFVAEVHVVVYAALHAARAELAGVADTIPVRRGAGR